MGLHFTPGRQAEKQPFPDKQLGRKHIIRVVRVTLLIFSYQNIINVRSVVQTNNTRLSCGAELLAKTI